MHICIRISMCMCNKNVQVSSIHGKNGVFIQMRIQMCIFFPVYGQNLYIFITHAHGNSNTNVHFFYRLWSAILEEDIELKKN